MKRLFAGGSFERRLLAMLFLKFFEVLLRERRACFGVSDDRDFDDLLAFLGG